jgi:hypothetical protein
VAIVERPPRSGQSDPRATGQRGQPASG